MRDVRSEFIRFWSMREVWWAALPVVVLCLVFSVINGEIMQAISSGDFEGHGLDPSLASKPLSELLMEGYLGPVYQASVIFIPLAVAYLAHMEYSNGEHESVLLNSQVLFRRRIGTILVVVSWSVMITAMAAVVNYGVCFILAGETIRGLLSVYAASAVWSRVVVFAVLFSVLALLVSALSHRLFLSVLFFLTLLLFSLSGILQAVPALHNLLPLIGGRSFAFWNSAVGLISIGESLLILVAWIVVSTVGYLFVSVGKRR